jgi:Clathrin light chain
LDDEERERVRNAELVEEERKRSLYEKMQQEDSDKKQRRVAGKTELDKWSAQRQKEIEQQRKTNEQMEKEYHEAVERARTGNNPWERVVNNCEMNSSQYVGGADVGRMRQAMLQRKADITKAGGLKKSNM